MRIYPSITGNNKKELAEKIKQAADLEIEEIPLFVQRLTKEERELVYDLLEGSTIKKIPLVHIKNKMDVEELKYLKKNFSTDYFTIHESGFDYLDKWTGFEKDLFLEMSTDNIVNDNVKVENIGGFCVDLSHYRKQKDRKTIDYEYVYNRRKETQLFKCNHVSGYSPQQMTDLHFVDTASSFDYLKELPDFVFGEVVAIEVFNSIPRQLEFKEYIESF